MNARTLLMLGVANHLRICSPAIVDPNFLKPWIIFVHLELVIYYDDDPTSTTVSLYKIRSDGSVKGFKRYPKQLCSVDLVDPKSLKTLEKAIGKETFKQDCRMICILSVVWFFYSMGGFFLAVAAYFIILAMFDIYDYHETDPRPLYTFELADPTSLYHLKLILFRRFLCVTYLISSLFIAALLLAVPLIVLASVVLVLKLILDGLSGTLSGVSTVLNLIPAASSRKIASEKSPSSVKRRLKDTEPFALDVELGMWN